LDRFLYLLSDAAGALALLVFVSVGGYLAVRYVRRRFPTAAERRLLDQQDAILDSLASLEQRLQFLEGNEIAPGSGDISIPPAEVPDRIPTPV
jgi:hypothetical protein